MRSDHPIVLTGEPPDPDTFQGPLNLFIELHGTAVAHNTAAETKADYTGSPAVSQRGPLDDAPEPTGPLTGAGGPVMYNRPHMIDTDRKKLRPY